MRCSHPGTIAINKNSKHFIERMNSKIYKHLGDTLTLWQEHKSSHAVIIRCDFYFIFSADLVQSNHIGAQKS